MAQPYVGEIRMFGGNFAPAGWKFCSGEVLLIAEYEVLFNLIGTTYGGDGQTTFQLPDMRGRVPIHFGGGSVLGRKVGVEQVTLTVAQLPNHTHSATDAQATTGDPSGAVPAKADENIYASGGTAGTMNATGIAGNSEPHDNLQPYLCVNFIISMFGIFPSQT